jgi:GH15 family glucan-1,4-alpha-glucosidase
VVRASAAALAEGGAPAGGHAEFLAAGPSAIEDYALIGDCVTAALVSRTGSIDWLCWPRFDSAACFAALLGTPENGTWRIAPADPHAKVSRRYQDGSVVLETTFDTAEGTVALVDFMPIGSHCSSVVRLVEGRRGRVDMRTAINLRFDYGRAVPWVTQTPNGDELVAIAGPDLAVLRSPVRLQGEGFTSGAAFTVHEGQTVPFVLSHGPSHYKPPKPLDARAVLAETQRYWARWGRRCTYQGQYEAAVRRSLVTLKALTYHPTGGIVAAPTTSLPEEAGGTRNWDYRFCWLRDATLTLLAFMHSGYFEEAQAWRDWLTRSLAGRPEEAQIMYGIGGERRLTEWVVDWLGGYQGARPVRIGNAAHSQLQLDVYGEVMDALHQGRVAGLAAAPASWQLQKILLDHLETIWRDPDDGIWESRGTPKKYTLSRVMAWVAFDRSIRSAERFGLPADLDRWRKLRDDMHATTCREGFDAGKNSFTQAFGEPALDASLLLIPMVDFLPASDPRVVGTVAAIERELVRDGFVMRYDTHRDGGDGLPPGENSFIACSFWLAQNYAMQDRSGDAERLFERLLAIRNDVGLLSEEYDPRSRRLMGNFPQAFSHIGLIGTALSLAGNGPVAARVNA